MIARWLTSFFQTFSDSRFVVFGLKILIEMNEEKKFQSLSLNFEGIILNPKAAAIDSIKKTTFCSVPLIKRFIEWNNPGNNGLVVFSPRRIINGAVEKCRKMFCLLNSCRINSSMNLFVIDFSREIKGKVFFADRFLPLPLINVNEKSSRLNESFNVLLKRSTSESTSTCNR